MATTITIALSDELHKRIKKYSIDHNIPMKELVPLAVQDYIKK